jgi:hypothetical protein
VLPRHRRVPHGILEPDEVASPRWQTTNNIVSLGLALEAVDRDFLLLEVRVNGQGMVEKFYLKSTPERPADLSGLRKTMYINSFATTTSCRGGLDLRAVDFNGLIMGGRRPGAGGENPTIRRPPVGDCIVCDRGRR